MANCHPSLRTARAVFPHTALRPYEFYLEAADYEIKSIVNCFGSDKGPSPIINKPKLFIKQVRKFVLISLIKMNGLKNGMSFISKLANSITKKGLFINIVSGYALETSEQHFSLQALIAGDGARPSKKETSENRGKLPPIQKLSEHLSTTYVPGKGGSSALQFFIMRPPNAEAEEYSKKLRGRYPLIRSLIGRVISGNFSFDKKLNLFYTPAFIEIGHELAHVYHSSIGVNAGEIQIRAKDASIWTDLEEYNAIIFENKIGGDFGLPQRFAHKGVPFEWLKARGMAIVRSARKKLGRAIANPKKLENVD